MGDNPKWQPILDVLPEMLHEAVKPMLLQWDQGVQQLLQERDAKLAPFKPFIDANVDPGYLIQAYQLAEQIQADPAAVVENMNNTFELGYVPAGQVPNTAQHELDNDDDLGLGDMSSLQDNPEFKALQDGIAQLTGKLTEMTEKQQQEEEVANFQDYLKRLHEEHGDFNDRFVTALISNGLEGPAAIEEYRKEIGAAAGDGTNNQQQQQQEQAGSNGTGTPPVVLDGRPAGGGTDQQPIDFGSMGKSDVNAYVQQLLAAGSAQTQ